ncbi:MAG: CBS domain-containing protein [Oscillospiraceae bacterium]|nr:CBS domain-containing protein [Oscillospiraceae bacterium]
MNILFFLTPKANCTYLHEDDTLRQAMERMESSGFSALPILKKDGVYCGTLTEGDLLWALKNLCVMDMKQTEAHTVMEIHHSWDNEPVSVSTNIEDLVMKATDQNFVPVVDDRRAFIGLVTRRAIMRYCLKNFFVPVRKVAAG